MLNAVDHIISPANAPWCSWVMLFLLLCAILAEVFQPGVITRAHVSILAKSERTYKESPMNFYGQIFVNLFRIGTLGMALCACLYSGRPFTFVVYAAVCGLVMAVLLIKMLCNVLIGYAFDLRNAVVAAYEHYANITTLAIVLVYLVLLVMVRFASQEVLFWALVGITFLFIAMWMFRGWKMFVSSPMAILYLVIYIATLEVLPIAGLYYLSDKTISIL